MRGTKTPIDTAPAVPMYARESTGSPTSRSPRWLIVYGAAIAVIGILALGALAPAALPLQGTRAGEMRRAQKVMDEGGAPLLMWVGRHYAPVGTTDDQGIYLFGPLVGELTGVKDPGKTVKILWLALIGITLFSYPLIFHRMFDSTAVAIAAPIAALILIASFGFTDIYWMVPWATITLLPPVMMAWRRWPQHGLLLLVAIGVGASFATSIRAYAGLPAAIATLALVVTRPWPARRRALVAATFVFAFLSIAPLGMAGVRAYRDHWAGSAELRDDRPSSHALWHTAFIGLGYLPNRWNIRWKDEVGKAVVRQVKPGARYLSKAYLAEMRTLYFRIVREQPGFYARTLADKEAVALRNSARYIVVAGLLLPFTLLVWPRRHDMRLWCLLTLPAILLGLIQPLIAIPQRSYELGLWGALGLVTILAGAAAVDPVLGALRRSEAIRLGWSLITRRSGRRAACIAGVIAICAAAIWVAARPIESRAARWAAQANPAAPLVP